MIRQGENPCIGARKPNELCVLLEGIVDYLNQQLEYI